MLHHLNFIGGSFALGPKVPKTLSRKFSYAFEFYQGLLISLIFFNLYSGRLPPARGADYRDVGRKLSTLTKIVPSF